jgi:hypothetical protein
MDDHDWLELLLVVLAFLAQRFSRWQNYRRW